MCSHLRPSPSSEPCELLRAASDHVRPDPIRCSALRHVVDILRHKRLSVMSAERRTPYVGHQGTPGWRESPDRLRERLRRVLLRSHRSPVTAGRLSISASVYVAIGSVEIKARRGNATALMLRLSASSVTTSMPPTPCRPRHQMSITST
jgi:hypothetical protein